MDYGTNIPVTFGLAGIAGNKIAWRDKLLTILSSLLIGTIDRIRILLIYLLSKLR